MAVIDSNNFITHLVWSGLIDKATCGELKEAIELCTVKDIYTKDDVVAMLTELQLEIEEHEESIIGHYGKETKESDFPSHKIERNNGRKECVGLIQQKIDKLKETD